MGIVGQGFFHDLCIAMKKWILVLAVLLSTAASTTPIVKHPDGSVTINTSTLEAEEGYMGPTPLLIHLDAQERVTGIEALPNRETPAYWGAVMERLSTLWNGLPVQKVLSRQVDAVSGATYSSQGFFSNLEKGINYYLNTKEE